MFPGDNEAMASIALRFRGASSQVPDLSTGRLQGYVMRAHPALAALSLCPAVPLSCSGARQRVHPVETCQAVR